MSFQKERRRITIAYPRRGTSATTVFSLIFRQTKRCERTLCRAKRIHAVHVLKSRRFVHFFPRNRKQTMDIKVFALMSQSVVPYRRPVLFVDFIYFSAPLDLGEGQVFARGTERLVFRVPSPSFSFHRSFLTSVFFHTAYFVSLQTTGRNRPTPTRTYS